MKAGRFNNFFAEKFEGGLIFQAKGLIHISPGHRPQADALGHGHARKKRCKRDSSKMVSQEVMGQGTQGEARGGDS